MAEIDADRLLWLVVGVQLMAELGDRPLAYRVEQEAKKHLETLLPPRSAEDPLPLLAPVVISDVYYLNNESIQRRPMISIGGPGVNAVSNLLVNEVPTAAAIENSLVIQMDLEFRDLRCAVWGMDHLQTVQAVELFTGKYLEPYLRAAAAWAKQRGE